MLAENKLMPIANCGMMGPERLNLADRLKRHQHRGILIGDTGSILMANIKRDRPDAERFAIDKKPFALDPENFKIFLDDITRTLRQYPGCFWGVLFADELQDYQTRLGVDLFDRVKDYPYILEVDRIVREKYGFGKFGMPESNKDENPYRWIAYRRWLNDRVNDMSREFRQAVKSVDPGLQVISMDPIAFIHPYDWSRSAEPFDIVTHQLYPRTNPNVAESATVTKMLVDLTNKPVWPCIHVENYAASFTPDEVRELLSQVFRTGGKGFHFYLDDTSGKGGMRLYSDFYGSPRRWRAIMGVLARARTMNELKMPDADCASFSRMTARWASSGRTCLMRARRWTPM